MIKPTKWHVLTKTRISLGIRPVWSESSLCAWRKFGALATHWTHSEDSDQTGRISRLIWIYAGRTCHFVGFVMRWLILIDVDKDYVFILLNFKVLQRVLLPTDKLKKNAKIVSVLHKRRIKMLAPNLFVGYSMCLFFFLNGLYYTQHKYQELFFVAVKR